MGPNPIQVTIKYINPYEFKDFFVEYFHNLYSFSTHSTHFGVHYKHCTLLKKEITEFYNYMNKEYKKVKKLSTKNVIEHKLTKATTINTKI